MQVAVALLQPLAADKCVRRILEQWGSSAGAACGERLGQRMGVRTAGHCSARPTGSQALLVGTVFAG
jgi:hypothetical protein